MYKFAALLIALACAVSAAPKPGYLSGYSGYDNYNGNIGYGLNGYGSNGYYGNGYGSGFGGYGGHGGYGGYGGYGGNVIGYGAGNGYHNGGYGTGYNRW